MRVLDPGLLTTVQDRGRWGSQALGVPVSGPMDGVSHRLANLLVGNDPDCATLEVTLTGPTLEFLATTTFAVAGAAFDLHVDGRPVPHGVPHHVGRGRCLRFGRRVAGARAYLAVTGGIEVPLVLGSRSTDLASGLGGLDGRALRAGDRLEIGGARDVRRPSGPREAPLPLPRGGASVRVLPGGDEGRFDRDILDVFWRSRFTIQPESNRMGYRLLGPSLAATGAGALLSSATPVGTVQVPPTGQPIVLMSDRQTMGGYPKVATVISADLPVAGQLAPGDWIAFERCDRRVAVAALIAVEQKLMRAP